MGTQKRADRLKMSQSGQPIYGQNDGVGVLPDAGGSSTTHDGLVAVSNGDASMSLDYAMLPELFEDFLGSRVVALDSGLDADNGPLVLKDVSTGGSPTLARVADAADGQLALTMDTTSEAQQLVLYANDELNINTDQEPVFICRASLDAQFAGSTSILVMGLAGPYNAAPDSVANHAWFRVEGANLNLLLESDDATTDTDDIDSTTDLVAATMAEFKVSTAAEDGASPTDVKFFYRTTLGGDWTEQKAADGTKFVIGANVDVQPYVHLGRASGADADGIKLDYVRCYWKRSA